MADKPETLSRRRILVVVDSVGDPFVDRLVAEIRSINGLDVVMQTAGESLDADARRARAEVAIRRLASGKGVEVWMSEMASGRSLLRQLVVDESPGGPDESLIALQTAEIVRTALADAESSRTAQSMPTPTLTAATDSPSPPKAAIQAGVSALSSRGGASPSLQACLSYHQAWSYHLGIAFDLSAPLAEGAINSSQGSASVKAFIAGAGLLAPFENEGQRTSLAATLGIAIASVHVAGRAMPQFLSNATTVSSGLAYLRLQGGWNPTRWLGVGATAMFGTTTTRIRIQFPSQDVGEWGMPIAEVGAYGEVHWE